MLDLADKTVVVTGASRGLGRTVAVGLARRGARVALLARSAEALEDAAREIAAAGGTALPLAANVADVDEVERVKQRVEAELGPPQILINAAGDFGPIQLVHQSDPLRWNQALLVNVVGPYLTCRAFVGGMIEGGWGRIVNFSSAASLHTPGPLNSSYATSKVALNQFTRNLAAELAGTGVTANVIHPGEVKTAMWAAIRDESRAAGGAAEAYRAWAADVAKTGGDDPHKALDLILELLDDRSADVNGQFMWIADGLQRPLPSW